MNQTPRVKGVLDRAALVARERNCDTVGTEHVLIALCGDDETNGGQVLRSLGITPEKLRDAVNAIAPIQQPKCEHCGGTGMLRG